MNVSCSRKEWKCSHLLYHQYHQYHYCLLSKYTQHFIYALQNEMRVLKFRTKIALFGYFCADI